MSKRLGRVVRGVFSDALQFKLTEPGKQIFLATLLASAAGAITLEVPLYHVFTALLSLLMITIACSIFFWPRVDVRGKLPDRVVAGQEVTVRFELYNRSTLPAFEIALGLFDLPIWIRQVHRGQSIQHLPAKRRVRYDLSFLPSRRGVYEFPAPRCFTTFPFNLLRGGPRGSGHHRLTVLPSFHPLESLDLPVSARYQPGGIALTSNIGESPEYIGNRDYRPGDSLRRIDPKAWGRLATPIVKEYAEEYYCRVAIVLDTYVRPSLFQPQKGLRELEAAVSTTAALADSVCRGEHIVDLFAAGPDLYVFRSGRHVTPLDSVLEILAGVGACSHNPFEQIAPAVVEELASISSAVFVLLDWDHPRRELVRAAVETGCGVKVILIRSRATSLETDTAEQWVGPFVRITAEQARMGKVDSL